MAAYNAPSEYGPTALMDTFPYNSQFWLLKLLGGKRYGLFNNLCCILSGSPHVQE